MAKKAKEIVVVFADTHSNSTLGLCPPEVHIGDGMRALASKSQLWSWKCWNLLWDKVEKLDREVKPTKIIAVGAGDLVDVNKHSGHQLISQNKSIIVRMAKLALERPLSIVDEFYALRGTEAHGGGCGEYEELLAHDIGAVEDPKFGTSSWWHLPLESAGVKFDITHHPATNSLRPWTLGSAACRQSAMLINEYQGEDLPQVAIRAHVHHIEDSGVTFPIRTFFLPAWKVSGDSYDARSGRAGQKITVGALIFICENGKYIPDMVKWSQRQ